MRGFRSAISGQVMFEYVWLCLVLVLALILPLLEGRSAAALLFAAIVQRIARFVGWLAVI